MLEWTIGLKSFTLNILYPKVFEESYKDGKIWANMGGIEGTLDDGLTDFKSNFSPVVQEYIESSLCQ